MQDGSPRGYFSMGEGALHPLGQQLDGSGLHMERALTHGAEGAAVSAATPASKSTTDQMETELESSAEMAARGPSRTTQGTRTLASKRKSTALMDRPTSQHQLPSLAQGVEQLLQMELPPARASTKRARTEHGDPSDQPVPTRASRRNHHRSENDFNASALIGAIFLRVQGTRAPAPMVYFADDIRMPQWFKESIDGVQPVISHEEFDLELVNLESMGKLVDGSVLPATLGEAAAYFSHVLGDPRTNKEINPRVLIAIQCDRAKGWFTYRRDHDNSNFVPVVLCASENGRGLEEVSPAHFEVHRAQCAQKKWRQSFKVLGAQKLHKVTSLAQAALGDVLRHLERILGGADKPVVVKQMDAATGQMVPVQVLPPRITPATAHPTFRHAGGPAPPLMPDMGMGMGMGMAMADLNGGAPLPLVPGLREHVPTRTSVLAPAAAPVITRLPSAGNNSTGGTDAPVITRLGGPANNSPLRPSGIPPGARPAPVGARPAAKPPTITAIGAGAPRRHTDDPAARPHDMPRGGGLDLLATAASNAMTSPRGGSAAQVQASLLAAALTGISYNELLQLIVDNNARKQQHAQQAQLLQQLAELQKQALAGEKVDVMASVAASAASLGVKVAARSKADASLQAAPDAVAASLAKTSSSGAKEGTPVPEEGSPAAAAEDEAAAEAGPSTAAAAAAGAGGALSGAEREAIGVIMKGVKGMDVAHAVRGILQHVAMQYASSAPQHPSVVPALTQAIVESGMEEGVLGELEEQEQDQEQQEEAAAAGADGDGDGGVAEGGDAGAAEQAAAGQEEEGGAKEDGQGGQVDARANGQVEGELDLAGLEPRAAVEEQPLAMDLDAPLQLPAQEEGDGDGEKNAP